MIQNKTWHKPSLCTFPLIKYSKCKMANLQSLITGNICANVVIKMHTNSLISIVFYLLFCLILTLTFDLQNNRVHLIVNMSAKFEDSHTVESLSCSQGQSVTHILTYTHKEPQQPSAMCCTGVIKFCNILYSIYMSILRLVWSFNFQTLLRHS